MHPNEQKCDAVSMVRFGNLDGIILEKKLKNTQCGMGFAIISEIENMGTLYNINMWGKEVPYLLFPTLYMETLPNHTFKKQAAEKEGSLCLYEMKIANHESKEWAKYLESEKTSSDKSMYLKNFAPSDLLKEK